MERLQKFLATAGIASRRSAEDLIRAGRVAVNGEVVSQMGIQIDPAIDRVTLDGRPITHAEPKFYVAVHKPRGYLASVNDERGRPTVMQLLPKIGRLYPVGRLDLDSEGLLLITNDGEMTHRLLHPRHHVDREYHALVAGEFGAEALETLRTGVLLEEGMTFPARVGRLRSEGDALWLRLVIHEGRKRQVRRMVQAVGGQVIRLVRVRIDGVSLGTLRPGQWRELTDDEVRSLRGVSG